MKVGHEHPAVPGILVWANRASLHRARFASLFSATGMFVPATDWRGLGTAKERSPVCNEDAERLRAERKAAMRVITMTTS